MKHIFVGNDHGGLPKSIYLKRIMNQRSPLAILMSISLLCMGCTNDIDPNPLAKDAVLCVHEQCFTVAIAQTPQERALWLMYRKSLSKDAGMWFIFEGAKTDISFWMKNTLIPLDMIWCDANKRIVAISHDVPPCVTTICPTYTPDTVTGVQYVLELAWGTAQEYTLQVGDTLVEQ